MALRIGEVDLSVDANTEGLLKSISVLRAYAREIDKVADSAEKGAAAQAAAMARQESQTKRALQQVLNLQALMTRADYGQRGINSTTHAYKKLTDEMTSGKLSAVDYIRAIDAFNARMGRQKRALDAHKATQLEQARAAKAAHAAGVAQWRAVAMASQDSMKKQEKAAREVERAAKAAAREQAKASKEAHAAAVLQWKSVAVAAQRSTKIQENAAKAAAREAQRSAAEQAKAARAAAVESARIARTAAVEQAKAQRIANQEASRAASIARLNEAALLRQSNAVASVTIQAKNMMAALKGANASDAAIRPLVGAFASLKTQMESGVLTSRQYSEALNRWRAQAAETARSLKAIKMGNVDGQVKPISKLTQAIRQLESASVLAVGPLSGIGSRIRALASITSRTTLAMAAFVAGLSATAIGLGMFSLMTLRTVIQMERVDAMLTSVTRSSAVAANEFKFITASSRELGLNLLVAAKGYGQLTAAARGTTLEGMKTRELFVALSRASSALQLSTDQYEGSLLAIQQMMSKGKVQAEELRGQLGERLYGAFNLAAEAMGKTTAELSEMMAEGKVMTDEFMPKFIDQLNKIYEEGSKAGAESLTGRINTLATAFQQLQLEFNRVTGLSEKFKAALVGLTSIIDSMRFGMDGAVKILAGLAGAFITATILKYAGALFMLISRMGTAAVAAGTLKNALMLIPWARLAGFAIKAGVVLGGFAIAASQAGESVESLSQGTAEIAENAKGYMVASSAMRTALQDMREETTRNAATQLNAIDKEIKARDDLIGRYIKFMALSEKGTPVKKAQELSGFNVAQIEQAKKVIGEMKELADQQKEIRENIVKMAMAPAKENESPSILGEDGDTSSQVDKLGDLLKSIRAVREEIMVKNDAITLFEQGREDAFTFAEAVLQAKDQLSELSPAQVSAVGQALQQMGYAGGNVTEQLAALFVEQTSVNDAVSAASEALEEYKNVLAEVADVQQDMSAKAKAIQLFQGGDADAFKFVDSLLAAQKALKDLSNTQLAGVSKQLTELGYTGATTAEQLAKLYMAQENMNEQMQDMEERAKKTPEVLREYNMEMKDLSGTLDAMRKGSKALSEFGEMSANARAVEALNKDLMETNILGDERNRLLAEYGMKLAEVTEEQKRMAVAQELAQEMNSAFRDLVYNIGDAKTSLSDFFDSIHRMLTEKIVFEPLEQWMEQTIGNFMRGASNQKTGGGDGLGGNFFGSVMSGVMGLFSGGGAGAAMGSAGGGLMADLFSSGIFSGGGMVSKTGPALVHAGEGVFTPDQINALGNGAGGTPPNVIINTSGAQMQVDYSMMPNGDIVIDIVAQAAAQRLMASANSSNASAGQRSAAMSGDLNKAFTRNG